jgi:hypothetical protein
MIIPCYRRNDRAWLINGDHCIKIIHVQSVMNLMATVWSNTIGTLYTQRSHLFLLKTSKIQWDD